MAVTLHHYWRSTASYRVRIALALKGISYDRVPVDLVAGEQKTPEYLAINPQGFVPAMEVDGQVLTQSLAILEYLEETHPDPALLPKESIARAYVRALSLAIACDVHPISNLSVLRQVEALAGPEGRKKWNQNNINRGLTVFEEMLDHPGFSGQFCYGESPSMADCILIPQLFNSQRWNVPYDHLPRISAVAENCSKLAAFTAAQPDKFKPS